MGISSRLCQWNENRPGYAIISLYLYMIINMSIYIQESFPEFQEFCQQTFYIKNSCDRFSLLHGEQALGATLDSNRLSICLFQAGSYTQSHKMVMHTNDKLLRVYTQGDLMSAERWFYHQRETT